MTTLVKLSWSTRRDTGSRAMKRFLLGAAIAALLAPNAFGQSHELPKKVITDGDGDIVYASFIYDTKNTSTS